MMCSSQVQRCNHKELVNTSTNSGTVLAFFACDATKRQNGIGFAETMSNVRVWAIWADIPHLALTHKSISKEKKPSAILSRY